VTRGVVGGEIPGVLSGEWWWWLRQRVSDG
jgi:hypothetical protein